VGKIFKPDLRKQAITRIFNADLEAKGLEARVTNVIDDKKRGLVAQVTMNGSAAEDVDGALGGFIRPWEEA
jgi:fatty-acyl-CoA synthase/long-chain acyl-CoA synthetase